jgi:1-pyrroline-5-carboxylate dehydrogenase
VPKVLKVKKKFGVSYSFEFLKLKKSKPTLGTPNSLLYQLIPCALTGSIFSNDKYAMMQASRALRYSAGNFYINDKPTGALVGQQPFGGARASGTNDKAGSHLNLTRWVSPRTIKETLTPSIDFKYPFMEL